MSFLVLLLLLLLEKFSGIRGYVQQDAWFLRALSWAQEKERWSHSPWLLLLILVGLPCALLAVLIWLLGSVMFGWLLLPLHIVVLLYGLGRGDVQQALGSFRDAWRREDLQGEFHAAERDLGFTAENAALLEARAQKYLLWQGYQGFFAPIFWYLLLGPILVLAYRLLDLVQAHSQASNLHHQAKQLRHALDWLPVRALAATFALVGQFEQTVRQLLWQLLNWDIKARHLLDNCARAASALPAIGEAQHVESLHSIWQLLVRSAFAWYLFMAFWVVFA